VRRGGCIVRIEDTYLTGDDRLVFRLDILAGAHRVGLVKLLLDLSETEPYTCLESFRKLARIARAVGVTAFDDSVALRGIPFLLFLSDADLGDNACCILAHSWDCEPLPSNLRC